MPRRVVIVVAVAFVSCLPSCHDGLEVTGLRHDHLPPIYHSIASVKQTMAMIVDPAADAIWDSSGFIITAEGERDRSPGTTEGWERVRDNAAILAEAGNLLLMPGRSAGPDWIAYAKALTLAGENAMNAAGSRDANRLFDAGGQIYRACNGCHAQFMLSPEKSRRAR